MRMEGSGRCEGVSIYPADQSGNPGRDDRYNPVAVSFFMNCFRKLGFVDYDTGKSASSQFITEYCSARLTALAIFKNKLPKSTRQISSFKQRSLS